MGRRFPQGCLRGCRWSTAKPSPAGTPARRSAVEAALAGFRDIRTGSSNVALSSHAVPDGGGAFPLAAFFQRRIVSATFNRQEWLWIPTKKTIKGAQSVYRVLNILEEVILCGDRMITPKELSASLDIPLPPSTGC